MKTLTTLLASLAFVLPLAVNAAPFEGTIKMKMSPPGGEPMPVTFSMKSGLSRMEMDAQGHKVVMIVDPAKKEATMLMPEQKMYMVHSLAAAENAAAEKNQDVSLEKTNEHEKILGFDATKYIAKSKGSTTEIWATEALGMFGGMMSGNPMGGPGGGRRGGGGGMAQAWENLLKGKELFPLRVVAKDTDGKEFRMEATDIKKESVPDSLFAPPADYQKFDMGGMMRGMGIPGMPRR